LIQVLHPYRPHDFHDVSPREVTNLAQTFVVLMILGVRPRIG
jgi:hypothetical protein